jgi:Histidinol-phosphate/aromatic aminotransferase and cobyric acid decarboxylase
MLKNFLKQSKKADILYLDSPNNPTGFQFTKTELQTLVKSFDGLVIIDEAYGEFADYSLSSFAKTQSNLIVVRTLSKSFGMAGIRLGYFVANKKFTDAFLNVLQYPYPLSTLTIESGILALENVGLMENAVKIIKSERQRIIETLKNLILLMYLIPRLILYYLMPIVLTNVYFLLLQNKEFQLEN